MCVENQEVKSPEGRIGSLGAVEGWGVHYAKNLVSKL